MLPASRPRVLLADDHPGVARAISRIMAFDCDVVEIVGDGALVVDAWSRHQPVVVVVDVNLPHVSGLDICAAITRANPRAKVIVMTAVLDRAIAEEAAAVGAFGFFPKLAAGDQLLVAVKRAWSELAD